MEAKDSLMRPAGDGIMRDMDAIELFEDLGDFSSWDSFKDREIDSQGDGFSGERHFIPGKANSNINLNRL